MSRSGREAAHPSESPVFVAGMPVLRAGLDEAAEHICADAVEGRGRVYVLVNAHSAKLRRESAGYARVLRDRKRTVGLADGASVTAAARMLGNGAIGRSPGPDLLEVCSARASREGIPVYLLGGADGVARALADALSSRHEGLLVAGMSTPPFGEWPEQENQRMVEDVRRSGARILWMGVSAPKQEVWAYEHLEELGIPAVCVGAAFDFNTGAKARAPKWMRRAGLEWVHRLMTEPGRMWKRYLIGNALFISDTLRFGRREAPAPAGLSVEAVERVE